MPPRVCVVCGETADLTRDHVIPRLVLRMLLGRELYAEFCTTVRKVNLQPMCSTHNGSKSHRVADLRSTGDHDKLLTYLDEFDILRDVVFEDPYDVFGAGVEKGPMLWLN